jgi:hypothetical protein
MGMRLDVETRGDYKIFALEQYFKIIMTGVHKS